MTHSLSLEWEAFPLVLRAKGDRVAESMSRYLEAHPKVGWDFEALLWVRDYLQAAGYETDVIPSPRASWSWRLSARVLLHIWPLVRRSRIREGRAP